jgi:hypothetical protein
MSLEAGPTSGHNLWILLGIHFYSTPINIQFIAIILSEASIAGDRSFPSRYPGRLHDQQQISISQQLLFMRWLKG